MTLSHVKQWLNKQELYTMNLIPKQRFNKGHIIAIGINDQWHADLAYMGQLTTDNDSVQHLLVIIDVFSRMLYVVPLKNKLGTTIVAAFSSLHVQPLTLRTDGGSEFTNKLFQNDLKAQKIRHYVARNNEKASMAERVIQTLKRKIYHHIVYRNNPEYISTLQQIVDSYNKTRHGSTGYAPADVTKANAHEVSLSQHLRLRNKQEAQGP